MPSLKKWFKILVILTVAFKGIEGGSINRLAVQALMVDNETTTVTQQPEPQPPVIGVLTQVLRDYKRLVHDRHFHIAAGYVKWIEGAGAQVLPILLNQNDSYYEKVFKQTNGLLLPGGDNLLDPHKNTPMMVAAKKLYKLAVAANDRGDFYPIWGTCLGMELLSVLTSNQNVLIECSANDMSLTVDFVAEGKLFAPSSYAGLDFDKDYAKVIIEALKYQNLTYNYHHKCLTDEGLAQAGLKGFYRPLSYSVDKSGNRFIAILEAKNYPFYGVQFHPEKAPYEFVVKKHQTQIPHSRQAIAVSRYFADFFVILAKQSNHRAENLTDLNSALIYSINPMYTAIKGDMYEQRYLFPYTESNDTEMSNSDEEFLDHLPHENETITEEVGLPRLKFGRLVSKNTN